MTTEANNAKETLCYRTAEPEDAIALGQYLLKVFSETDYLSQCDQDPPATPAQVVRTIAEAAKHPSQILLLAVDGEAIIGMLRFRGGTTRRTCHTGEVGLTVRKSHWGRGVATGLLTRFLNWAVHGRLIRQINLRVRPDNHRALTLYRRHGFVETGRVARDLCIDGRFYDHLLMGLAIDPKTAPESKEETAMAPALRPRRIGPFTYLAVPAVADPQRPTLLFLHGSGHSAQFWTHQLTAFEGQANCIALDLPGRGRSKAAVCTSVADHAAAVCQFLDCLATGPIIPVGLSLGGAIVQWLLVHHRQYCRAGVIVNSGARLRVAPAIFTALAEDYAGYLTLLKEMALAPSHQRDAEIDALLKRCTTADAAVTMADFRCCDRFDIMADLGHIDCPVLVLAATRDRLTPLKYAAYLTTHIARARQVIVEGAGHLSPLEAPTAVNTALARFVDTLVDG